MGKTWFVIEAKTFEISIEEKNNKLRGCIWERSKGATSWVRFGDSSLYRLLLGIEDCDMISHKQEWFANWEEGGRSYKLERRSNKAGNFLYCSVRDVGWKRCVICIPEGKGKVRGWKIMAEKLRSLGVGLKRLKRQKTYDREERKVPEKSILDTPRSFAQAVTGTGFGKTEEVVRVRVGRNEIAERLEQLESSLVGWWGGGTSPTPDLKSLKQRAWQTWKVTGSLTMEELRRGLWLFGFESPNEARRILREGTGCFGGLPISFREWGKEVGCMDGSERCKSVWVRLLGLPLHLWSRPILKRIGDRCGGFVAEDENTEFRIDPRWARIRVKWDGSSNPKSVVVSKEDRSYEVQLWWEIQPQMSWESRTSKQYRGVETREEGDVKSRARESVELPAQAREKKLEKSKGVLYWEMGKQALVERQLEGMFFWEEQKLKKEVGKQALVERQPEGMFSWEEQKLKKEVKQKSKGSSGGATGCVCRLGPTVMGQEKRWEMARKDGLGELSGGGPVSNRAQTEGPEVELTGPLVLLDPAHMRLSLALTDPSESPAKKQPTEEQKSSAVTPDWKSNQQNRGVNPNNFWKEGDRREDQVVIPSLENDSPRYVKTTQEDFSSLKISVFGRPLLMGDSSGQGGPLKFKEIDDLEPLRMVAVDGREWGLELSNALEEIEEGPGGEGQQGEDLASGETEASGYEKWEDSCLIKFSEFLGFSTEGFENEILGLLSKIVARQNQGENKGTIIKSRCERELKKLVCTINYDGKSQIKGGDKERGSIMLRS